MEKVVEIYTKESLVQKLKDICNMGWIKSVRQGNSGGVGNTLETLLGIEENNLPIPNAAEWELKCQRIKTNSLVTLFHMEPSPTALKFVPKTFLPKYGWTHKKAGSKYPDMEMSFRQTISTQRFSDKGFIVQVDRDEQKILISFDSSFVSNRHKVWMDMVQEKVGLCDLNPQPYWGFDDLYHKAGTKLHNCFFVGAFHRKVDGIEYFHYSKIYMLKHFSKERFIDAIESGAVLIDFDARTGHNHGTKFRFRNNRLQELYDDVTEIA